jgi:glycerol-3-phosphate dehydrogenase
VRPLFDDGASKAQEATRDYVLKVEGKEGDAPLLNVFGGKLTTYRRLAEHALEKIAETIGAKGASWTAGSRLPGGDFAVTDYEPTVAKLLKAYPFLQKDHAERLIRCYGTDAKAILGAARKTEDLGRYFGGTLYEAEVRWLIEREWAVTAEDVLWRRTKQGLFLTPEEAEGLEGYMGLMAAA